MKWINLILVAGIVGFASCDGEQTAETEETTAEAETPIANAEATKTDQATFEQQAEETKSTLPPTTMVFAETEHDFGTITDGDKVKHTFSFTNTGENPLVISNAKGSCGCTVPKWPREPIAPGASADIEVEFNSSKKLGKQTKTVTINANTEPEQTFLKISAQVEADPNAPPAESKGQDGGIEVKTVN